MSKQKKKKTTFPRDNFDVLKTRKPGRHTPRSEKRAKDKLRKELWG